MDELYKKMSLCVAIVHDIALVCKKADYPEDLEDIYDILLNNGVDFRKLEDDKQWLR